MRILALIPAAGESRRMGRPKLTLGLGRDSVIQRVVAAFDQAGADAVLVVAPPIGTQGAVVLANHARAEGAEVVHLDTPTADMRATIEVGLDALVDLGLAPADGVLIAPGDCVGLTDSLVRRVITRFQHHPDRIVVPVFQKHRGHPIAIPWGRVQEIAQLPSGVGVRDLLNHRPDLVSEVEVDDPGAVSDLDTIEDYRKWTEGKA